MINYFVKKYPKLFENYKGFNNNISIGWFNLIEDLCETAKYYSQQSDKKILIFNLQKKFGTLYIDHNHIDSFANNLFKFTESISYNVCEECGGKGRLHSSTGTQFGEFATLCNMDALKKLYKIL